MFTVLSSACARFISFSRAEYRSSGGSSKPAKGDAMATTSDLTSHGASIVLLTPVEGCLGSGLCDVEP
eukprot:scaffold266884_cov33-Tisochrysis_lutea.AAC.3